MKHNKNNWLDKYIPEAQNGIEGTMGGLTDIGFNYNGAWGGPSMKMGGTLPGSVGFTYARTQSPAPSNGPYAKKTKASAQNGREMQFYQNGLDWKPKTISEDGSVIEDDMGQWNHPGEITKINSNQITMEGVPYPVMGISDTGDTQMMYPEEDYEFDGESVTEIPMMEKAENGKTTKKKFNLKDHVANTKSLQDNVRVAKQPMLKNPFLMDPLTGQPVASKDRAELLKTAMGATRNQGTVNTPYKKSVREKIIDVANQIDRQGENPVAGIVTEPVKAAMRLMRADKNFDLSSSNSADIVNAIGEGALQTGIDALTVAPIAAEASPFLKQAGRFVTRETALKNAYRLNPFAFKPNPEAYYRGIGKEGMDDILNSGIIRSKKQNAYPEPYFSKGKIGDAYAKGYFAELNNEPMKGVGSFKTGDLIQTPVSTVSINNPNLKLYQKDWLQGYKQLDVPKPIGSVNNVPIIVQKGFPNPVAIVDKIIPRPPSPGHLLGMDDSWNNYSPLNLIPGYGKKLSAESELFKKGVTDEFGNKVLRDNIKPQYANSSPIGFRKFGNSIEDVVNRKALGPRGSGMGSSQIKNEGNWAEPGKVNEHYPGVFEATMNPHVEGSDILLRKWNNRNGIVGTLNDRSVDIPLSDPGLSFNRRLPFSNRYVSIDKNKLLNNQFQLATQLPHLQSLVEKYGIYAGAGGLSGYAVGGKDQAQKNINFINSYTIDPALEYLKKGYDNYDKLNTEFEKALGIQPIKKNGGQVSWLNKYK
jgi:hypothetical protein